MGHSVEVQFRAQNLRFKHVFGLQYTLVEKLMVTFYCLQLMCYDTMLMVWWLCGGLATFGRGFNSNP